MRIACYSDIHGQLPSVVDCDVAIVAGDIGPYADWKKQLGFLHGKFLPWISQFKQALFIAGNHDDLFATTPHLVPIERVGRGLGWVSYLENSIGYVYGPYPDGSMLRRRPKLLTVWGTPNTKPWGHTGAFMEHEGTLAERFSQIPKCDVLISHGPPYGYGDPGRPDKDGTPRPHVGSIALLDAIHRIQPKLVVCGHLHSGYGTYQVGPTLVVNAALTGDDKSGLIVNEPIIVDLET
jgi:hypothetical protein